MLKESILFVDDPFVARHGGFHRAQSLLEAARLPVR
jgi:hypothetical protein